MVASEATPKLLKEGKQLKTSKSLSTTISFDPQIGEEWNNYNNEMLS